MSNFCAGVFWMHNVFTLPHLFSLAGKIDYWSYLKIWEVFWTVKGDGFAMHTGRKDRKWGGGVCIIWRHFYKLLYFVCECIKAQSPQCCTNNWPAKVAQLTKGIAFWCVWVCWMHCAQVTCRPASLELCSKVQGQISVFHFVSSCLKDCGPSCLCSCYAMWIQYFFLSWDCIALRRDERAIYRIVNGIQVSMLYIASVFGCVASPLERFKCSTCGFTC